ncbi:MAG: 3-hydroxyacyl-CoA dehydrogenase, partial [Nitrospirota bacterium]|nr:3-hydroxyacyl-CoA dehydrogenase [Nitrospirota bacterium]
GPLYEAIEHSQSTPRPWTRAQAERIDAERRAALPAAELGARSEWRDRRLMALAAHKSDMTNKIGE